MSDTPPDDLLPLVAACKLLPSRRADGRPPSTDSLKRWIRSGRIRGWEVLGLWYVSKADLLALARPVQPDARPARGPTMAQAEAERRFVLERKRLAGLA